MNDKPSPLALADFLNEYRRDNVTSVSCANMMDAAAELLRTQFAEVSRAKHLFGEALADLKMSMLKNQEHGLIPVTGPEWDKYYADSDLYDLIPDSGRQNPDFDADKFESDFEDKRQEWAETDDSIQKEGQK